MVHYTERANGGSTRAIYNLPDKILADVISVNVGVYSPEADPETTDFYYHPVIGGMTTIRSCTLKSGDQVIDEFTAADVPQHWLTLHTLTCSNRDSVDVNRPELHSGWGFEEASSVEVINGNVVRRKGSLTLQDPNQDFSSVVDGVEPAFMMYNIAANQDGPSTQVNWSRVFPSLRAMGTLPRIPKLQLTHVYDVTPTNFVNPDDLLPADLPLTTINPLLLSNEILGLELTKDSYTTRFNRIKVDSGMKIQQPADLEAPTRTTYNCTAFDGLYVENLYFWTEPSQGVPVIPLNCQSRAMANEKIQVMVNGFPLLPLDGIEQEAEKMLYLTRTKGSANMPLAFYVSDMATLQSFRTCDVITSVFVGNMSLTGVHIGAVIDRLQIQYQRTLPPTNHFENQGLEATMHLMAEYAVELTTPSDGDPGKVTIAY